MADSATPSSGSNKELAAMVGLEQRKYAKTKPRISCLNILSRAGIDTDEQYGKEELMKCALREGNTRIYNSLVYL